MNCDIDILRKEYRSERPDIINIYSHNFVKRRKITYYHFSVKFFSPSKRNMEIIEALRYVEIVFLLCTLLFILFPWLPVSRHVLGVPQTGVYYNQNLAISVACSMYLAFFVNMEKRHGAVYSMTLQTTLLTHALTSMYGILYNSVVELLSKIMK